MASVFLGVKTSVCITAAGEAAGSAAACPRLLAAEGELLQELGEIKSLFNV